MKVTKIEPQKHNKNRYSIYVDDKFAIGVDREIVWTLNLYEGLEIDANMLERISYTEEKRKVKEKALNLLTYRARSKKELIDRLKEKGEVQPQAEINIIADVIGELETIGLVNDNGFAELWVRERSKLYGPFRLRAELIKKGIAQEIIDKTLSELNEPDIARRLAQKWMDRHKEVRPQNLPPDVLKRRLFSFLMRRGISYETINSLYQCWEALPTKNIFE